MKDFPRGQGVGADPFCKLSSVLDTKSEKGENRRDEKQSRLVKLIHFHGGERPIISKQIVGKDSRVKMGKKKRHVFLYSLILQSKIKNTVCVAILCTGC